MEKFVVEKMSTKVIKEDKVTDWTGLAVLPSISECKLYEQ